MREVLQLGKGLSIQDAQTPSVRARLAAARGLPVRAVRIEPVPSKRADQCVVVTMLRDPLAKPPVWAGPHLPGASISQPVEFATDANGGRVSVCFAGTQTRNAEHFLVAGQPGSGKSKTWQVIYGSVLCRRDVCVIVVDLVKGVQTVGPLMDGLALLVDTPQKLKAFERAVEQLIVDRTNWLGEHGFDEWLEGCGLEYLIIHVEEGAGVAGKTWIKIAERARSAGISLVLSMQRLSAGRVSTDVRASVGGSMCHGVRSSTDASMALSKETLKEGASPWLWANREPGRFYLECEGRDPRLFSLECRSDWIDKKKLQAAVLAGARYRCSLSAVSSRSLGPLVGMAAGSAGAGRIVRPVAVGVASKEGLAAELTADECRDRVWAWIQEQQGDTFGWEDIRAALLPVLGRSTTWLSLELTRLIKTGKLPAKLAKGIYRRPSIGP